MNQQQGAVSSGSKDLVFYLRIQYRCNSSWQGSLQWIDGRKTEVFRSVLELANLIESARRLSSEKSPDSSFMLDWEDKEIVS